MIASRLRGRLCAAFAVPLAALLPQASATAQAAPLQSDWQTVHIRSGVHANPSPVEGVVWSTFLSLPDTGTPWLRRYFAGCHLDKGSYLRIASLRDGDVQTLHMEHVEQWSYSSAFCNGHAVLIELVAAPGSQKNFVDLDKVLVGRVAADVPPPETICGATDDRVPSNDPKAGRIVGIGCTGWIIAAPTTGNDRLHLSAGHCFASGQVFQFGVPVSLTTCALVNPPAAQQFAIDDATSIANNGGIGNDYWVFRCCPNSNTGRTTWQTQSAAFTLATSMPANGTTLGNTGYGLDRTPTNGGANASSCGCTSPNGVRNQTQQTHTGALVSVSGPAMNHTIDTGDGNSGSPVTIDATGVAIAIHTNAGCTSAGGSNSGSTVTNADRRDQLAGQRRRTDGPGQRQLLGAHRRRRRHERPVHQPGRDELDGVPVRHLGWARCLVQPHRGLHGHLHIDDLLGHPHGRHRHGGVLGYLQRPRVARLQRRHRGHVRSRLHAQRRVSRPARPTGSGSAGSTAAKVHSTSSSPRHVFRPTSAPPRSRPC